MPTSLSDADFLAATADRLAALPTVRAVALGGSRAQGTARPDSDWDLAIYYRGDFDPADLRAVGWQGEVSEVGGWGGGVFNGGAWLTVDERRVDVHYRDLDVVEGELAQAQEGRFRVEPLLFHLAGIPTYLVVAELAVNQVLRGDLPRPAAYPAKLRASAAARWRDTAHLTLAYAEANHAPAGRLAETAGALATAAAQMGHSVLAARGEWVTNEKRLLERAGLRETDRIVASLSTSPGSAVRAVTEARALFDRVG
ncbi:nucleotidyltransferase domain-containing protein [Streptomyces griseorubiginosus]|uniref:nucleotidyltransferase domain-containing protein n=1 Tax=Streptomyces griseorubiginosus TaxID=67304 RepID=UPI00076D5668|nr:nucleotidyltransferase domain-containing protein [Streptomyces griseorubiginosus]KUM76562.1 DNA polymerase subunit beta [Streptomyces griseorubiginosus]